VVVDWFNEKTSLNVLLLHASKEKVKELGSFFSFLQVFHIHSSFNSQADKLSKIGLSSDIRVLFVEEFEEEEMISSSSYCLF